MKANELIAQRVNICRVREQAMSLALQGMRDEATMLMELTDVIQQQQEIIIALLGDQGDRYAVLKARFAATGTVLATQESINGHHQAG